MRSGMDYAEFSATGREAYSRQKRERQERYLEMRALGFTRLEIAKDMGISMATAKKYEQAVRGQIEERRQLYLDDKREAVRPFLPKSVRVINKKLLADDSDMAKYTWSQHYGKPSEMDRPDTAQTVLTDLIRRMLEADKEAGKEADKTSLSLSAKAGDEKTALGTPEGDL